MPGYVLETLDYLGNPVTLETDRWHRHIITRHAEVKDYLTEIERLLRFPQIVTEDMDGVWHFSRLGAVEGKWKALYLEAVVRYKHRGQSVTGEVLTAYFNARPPRGEIRWMQR